MAKYPEYATARESLATLLISQGNISQAQQVIRVGLQQRPFYPPYIQLKARILVNEGKVKQALNLLQLEPPPLAENPDYHALIAALYQRQGQPNFAEKLYEQLLVIQPHNPTWWTGLGIALESLGKRTLAINAYTKVKESSNLSPELKIYAETRLRNLLEMQG
jgi:MSHA biogenesis protein MshN